MEGRSTYGCWRVMGAGALVLLLAMCLGGGYLTTAAGYRIQIYCDGTGPGAASIYSGTRGLTLDWPWLRRLC